MIHRLVQTHARVLARCAIVQLVLPVLPVIAVLVSCQGAAAQPDNLPGGHAAADQATPREIIGEQQRELLLLRNRLVATLTQLDSSFASINALLSDPANQAWLDQPDNGSDGGTDDSTDNGPGTGPDDNADDQPLPADAAAVFALADVATPTTRTRFLNGNDDPVLDIGTVLIENRDFIADGQDHAIRVVGNVTGTIVVRNCSFTDFYQAIVVTGRVPDVTLVLIDCAFNDATGSSFRDQAVYMRSTGSFYALRCSFTGTARRGDTDQAHGVYLYGDEKHAWLYDCSFTDIEAAGGKFLADDVRLVRVAFTRCAYAATIGKDPDRTGSLGDARSTFLIDGCTVVDMQDIPGKSQQIEQAFRIQRARGLIRGTTHIEPDWDSGFTAFVELNNRKSAGLDPIVTIESCTVPDDLPALVRLSGRLTTETFRPSVTVLDHRGAVGVSTAGDASGDGVVVR